VTDFGLALPVEVEQSLADMEGSVAGSIPYMAPEVREGKGALARSDLYAWGVLLFEVLTGALPGAAETPSSLGADKKWDDVYRRACARLEARFESADEALAALPAAPAPRKAAPPKVDVRALLDRVAKEEAEFLQKEFMAYVTPEGKAHARVRGKTYSFDVKGPPGLAILRATGPTVAVVVKRFGRGV